MSTILVTGATGTLGTPTAAALRESGHDVRALSRASGPGLTSGNLLTGSGIAQAFSGADTVVHLATGKRDVDQARAAMSASRAAGVGHFVLISIVGIDDIPLGYYKGKLLIEAELIESGVPHSILRATQFHQFVDNLVAGTRFSPVIVAPKFSFQPISTSEVATRLTELAGSDPAGRVADIGGPEQRTAHDLALAVKLATSSRRPIVNLALPGKTFAGFVAARALRIAPALWLALVVIARLRGAVCRCARCSASG